MTDDFFDAIARVLAPGRDAPMPPRDQLWRDVTATRTRSTRARARRRIAVMVGTLLAASIVVVIVARREAASRRTRSPAPTAISKSSAQTATAELPPLTESERASLRVIDSTLARAAASPGVANSARAAEERAYLLSVRRRVIERAFADRDGAE